MLKVGIIMGSAGDLEKVAPAAKTLKEFGVPYEAKVLSAHRTPDEAAAFAASARENGFGALICAAGKAAHLAGAVAARTTLPVIGIPVKTSALEGMDALLSTVQMPSGMPVATVAIDGAVNAALLAVQILAVTDAGLAAKLEAKRAADREKILAAKTVFVNGPMGVFEKPETELGTKAIWQALADTEGFTVVGGGDSIAATEKYGLTDKMGYICTGGGALIRFLSGEELPVVAALRHGSALPL